MPLALVFRVFAAILGILGAINVLLLILADPIARYSPIPVQGRQPDRGADPVRGRSRHLPARPAVGTPESAPLAANTPWSLSPWESCHREAVTEREEPTPNIWPPRLPLRPRCALRASRGHLSQGERNRRRPPLVFRRSLANCLAGHE